jgi:hypothetical protein
MALHLPLTKNSLEVNDFNEKEGSVKDSTIAPDESALDSDTADSELSFDCAEQDTWAMDETSPRMRQRVVGAKSGRPESPKELMSAWTQSSYDAVGSASADLAAGSPHKVTISSTGKLALICRQAPGVSLFGSMALFLIAAAFWPSAFLGLLSLLTAQVYCWIGSLAIFALVGVQKMRSSLATDWEARWNAFAKENPDDANACKHILILPNYKEDENMLCDTLDNLARFPLAKEQMHIVLAMECREGSGGRHKAERLIASHKHCLPTSLQRSILKISQVKQQESLPTASGLSVRSNASTGKSSAPLLTRFS